MVSLLAMRGLGYPGGVVRCCDRKGKCALRTYHSVKYIHGPGKVVVRVRVPSRPARCPLQRSEDTSERSVIPIVGDDVRRATTPYRHRG